jgi:excisionase family DNA binding protein
MLRVTGTPDLLTIDETAVRIRQSKASVYRKVASGEIRALKLGSGPKAPLRIPADELETWLYASAPRQPPSGAAESQGRRANQYEYRGGGGSTPRLEENRPG